MNDYRAQSGSVRSPGRSPSPALSPEPFSRRLSEFSFRSRERRRPSRMAVGVALAILLAVTALVIALVSLQSEPVPAANSSNPQAATAADKALCQAVGPLMKENDDRSNAFLASGQPGTPQRDA